MKLTAWVIAGSILTFSIGSVYAADTSSSFKVMLGTKSLDAEWGKDDSMDSLGLLYSYFPSSLPVGLAVDVYGSGNESGRSIKTETSIGEINLGLRFKSPQLVGSFSPYVGGGVSFVNAEIEASSPGSKTTYDDTGVGYWVGGGVDYTFAKHWTLGVDVRYTSVDVTLNGQDRDAGGTGFGATLGYEF